MPKFMSWLARCGHPCWARRPPSPPAGGAAQSKTCTTQGMSILVRVSACRQECRQGTSARQGWALLPALPRHHRAHLCPLVLAAAVTCGESSLHQRPCKRLPRPGAGRSPVHLYLVQRVLLIGFPFLSPSTCNWGRATSKLPAVTDPRCHRIPGEGIRMGAGEVGDDGTLRLPPPLPGSCTWPVVLPGRRHRALP